MHKIFTKIFIPLFLVLVIFTAMPVSAQVVVQVMSVQDEVAATKETDRLFNLGIPTFQRAENVPELGTWNRVYVGPFETESDATAAANTLKNQGVIKSFVIKSGEASSPEPSPAQAQVAPEANQAPPALKAETAPVQATKPGEVAPFELPAVQAPTYGEPVSPEMANELNLQKNNANRLPTYGESSAPASTAAAPKPSNQDAGSLPDFSTGQDMPGIAIQNAPEPQSSSSTLAPSAGDEDAPIMVAQTTIEYNRFDQEHNVNIDTGRDLAGFALLVDLSSSMRRLSNCPSHVKEEAVASLLRKMNHRIPAKPYNASLRVFGYKQAWLRRDLTTLYFGPATYNRDQMEDAIGRLVAADSVSPFADALKDADEELNNMGSIKAVLMFSDFEANNTSGNPVQNASNLRRRFGQDVQVFTFHATRQPSAVKLARNIAEAGGGKAYDICHLLNSEEAFESMMMEIFGPATTPPCPDSDGDGVCDADDLCPNTPLGAAVDYRGCWVAAYSQFFDFNKAVVKDEFLPRIRHAAEVLNNNPNLPTVIIAGHTDNIGSHDFNMDLGLRRANAVRNLLIEYGVPRDRMVAQTYGFTKPIATNDTPEGRAQNRRVEFHIGQVPYEGNQSR